METINPIPAENWPRCPAASEFFFTLFRAFTAHNPAIGAMSDRFLERSGVSLLNLIDHWAVPHTVSLLQELGEIGLQQVETEDGDEIWEHPSARLPRIRVEPEGREVRMAIAVEDIRHFAECNDLPVQGQHGDPDSGYEETRYPLPGGTLAVVARSGYRGFRPGRLTAADARVLTRTRRALIERPRGGDGAGAAEDANRLLHCLREEVHRDRLVDEFFRAERAFYMERNAAARWQYERQQQLGFGWANHDHHTYRSSRNGFRPLLNMWTQFGFEPRERFYAGAEAGWGAQILEHPISRVVLFCDVDMDPEELSIDYLTVDLPPLDALGTIGLWCALHTDSIAAAGLHHLEAEYDYARIREQLEAAGFGVMPPFTDLPMLKQAFTTAEMWPVVPVRVRGLYDLGLITGKQRDRFEAQGAPGSHLEILQRWDGFKGFNKTGIDAIIRKTDAREVSSSPSA